MSQKVKYFSACKGGGATVVVTGEKTSFTFPSDREIAVTYIFDVPREIVFKAYTDPALIPKWWGPRNLVTTVESMDLRPGGVWRFIQRDQDGKEYAFSGVYRNVKPPEQVVYSFEYEDLKGHVSVETVIFEEQDGKTKVTDKTVFLTAEDRDEMLKSGMEEGVNESMERLTALLKNLPYEQGGGKNLSAAANEVVIIKVLNAPLMFVWKAWTEPERVQRWWGPKNFTSPFCSIDLRVGGKYLFCMRSPDGNDYWSTGVYQEIIPMNRLIYTDSFADEKGNIVPASYYGLSDGFPLEMPVTVTFEEQDGKTKLTIRYSNITGLSDTDLNDMRQGWNESLDKLQESLSRGQTYLVTMNLKF